MSCPRFTVYDRWGAGLFELTDVLSATWSQVINELDTLEIKTRQGVSKGDRIVWRDGMGLWHEHIASSIDVDHSAQGAPINTVYCENSLAELRGDYIVNKRPGVGQTSGTSQRDALTAALSASRWSVGMCESMARSSASMYHVSAFDALSTVVENWGGELQTVIAVNAKTGVTGRTVNLRAHLGNVVPSRRFDYSRDVSGITRTYDDTDVITACYAWGKGEELESGGYGRRIGIADVNGGVAYVEDADALAKWGRPDGNGGKAHAFGAYLDEDEEDAAALLAAAKEYLAENCTPYVTYTADVLQFGAAGADLAGVSLGDAVQIVDTAFNPEIRMQGRILEIETDLLNDSNPTITLGNFKKSIDEQFGQIKATLGGITDRSAAWDAVSLAAYGYIDKVIESLNDMFASSGGFVTFDTSTGITVTDKATAEDSTMAINISGAGFRIADSKNSDGTWDWRTFGTGAGFTADEITAGTLTTILIKDTTGENYWNLATGEIHFKAVASAQAAAESAQAAAESAESSASTAQGTANEAQETARQALQTAAEVQVTADAIKTEVSENYITKNDASTIYATKTTVEQTADALTVKITDAEAAASAAQGTADSALAAANSGVIKVEVQYAQNQSTSTAPTSGWSATAPTWKDGYYVWQRTVTTYKNGNTSTSTATCISGAKGATGATGAKGDTGATGATGATGKGISAIKPQYYLSTSSTSQAGGSWVDACPAWSTGKYIWTRSYVTWTDGTTSTTTPALDSGLNTANTTANTANTTANSAKSTANSAYNAATAVNLIPGFCAQASEFCSLHANWKRTAGYQDSVGGSSGWCWLNKVDNSSGSSTAWVNVYDAPCASMQTSATTYTLLVEWSGVTYTGTAPTFYAGKSGSATIPQFSNLGSVALTNGAGSECFSLTSTAASTARTADTCTRITIKVPAGSTLQGSFRFSLYRGSYSGPYVPPAGSVAMERASTLIRATSSGLEVGKVKADNTRSGPYCLVNSAGSYDIYSQDSVRLSSFGASSVKLGENSASSVIEICGGIGEVFADSGSNQIMMRADGGAYFRVFKDSDNGIGIIKTPKKRDGDNTGAFQVDGTYYYDQECIKFSCGLYAIGGLNMTYAQLSARLNVRAVTVQASANMSLKATWQAVPCSQTKTIIGWSHDTIGFTVTGGSIKCNFTGKVLVFGNTFVRSVTSGHTCQAGIAISSGALYSGTTSAFYAGSNTPMAGASGPLIVPLMVASVTKGQYISLLAANWSGTSGTVYNYNAGSGSDSTSMTVIRIY